MKNSENLLAPYLPQQHEWPLWVAVLIMLLFVCLNFQDFYFCVKVSAQRRLPKAVLVGLFVSAIAASVQLFDLKGLLNDLQVPALLRNKAIPYALTTAAIVAVTTWLLFKKKKPKSPFTNTFLKPGVGSDEVVIFVIVLAVSYNVFLVALPPTRESLIGRLSALLVSKQYLRLNSELQIIQDTKGFSDIYHYYYGWYLRNNLHLGDPDSQFRQVPESSSLYFDSQKARVLHSNSFFLVDRDEHFRRLDLILSDLEESRLADSSFYFYVSLLRSFPEFEQKSVERLYHRFLARNGENFDRANFSVRLQGGRDSMYNLFRIADAIPVYFFFQAARMVAFDQDGKYRERNECLLEARRQLNLLGPERICWHFRSSFEGEGICRYLVGVVKFPFDPIKRDAESKAFRVPDESDFTVRIESKDGKELLLKVEAITGV